MCTTSTVCAGWANISSPHDRRRPAAHALRERRDSIAVSECPGRGGHLGPRGSAPPKHFHPGQDERFEVTSGTLRARVDGREHTLTTGQTLEIPRGAVHQMWNDGSEPAHALWVTSPAGRTAQWFEALASAGKPGPLDYGVLLSEYRDVFRLAGPQPLVLGAMSVLGAVGRRLGRGAVAS
jgi:mannose-6-phosphate isomerase-like protein (cupin superfamily)